MDDADTKRLTDRSWKLRMQLPERDYEADWAWNTSKVFAGATPTGRENIKAANKVLNMKAEELEGIEGALGRQRAFAEELRHFRTGRGK